MNCRCVKKIIGFDFSRMNKIQIVLTTCFTRLYHNFTEFRKFFVTMRSDDSFNEAKLFQSFFFHKITFFSFWLHLIKYLWSLMMQEIYYCFSLGIQICANFSTIEPVVTISFLLLLVFFFCLWTRIFWFALKLKKIAGHISPSDARCTEDKKLRYAHKLKYNN